VISVISIKGAQTRLEDIGTVADITRGAVELVNPNSVAFGESVNKRIVASNCTLTLYLPRELRLRNVSPLDEAWRPKKEGVEQKVPQPAEAKDAQLTPVLRDVGNVTDDSQVCYEFGVWAPAAEAKSNEAPVGPEEEAIYQPRAKWQLPIQVQFEYRRLDGAQIRRVVTVMTEVKSNEREVRAALDIRVVSANLAQQCGQMARGGHYEAALEYATRIRTMIREIVRTQEQRDLFATFDQEFVTIQATLTAAIGRENANRKGKAGAAVAVSASSRQADRDDMTAQKLYSYQQSSSAACSLM